MNKIKLENLREWEEIKLILRRHWIILVYMLVYVFFIALSLIIILAMSKIITSMIPVSLFWICVVLYSMVSVLLIYIKYISYELDIYIITNMRIIWVEQIAFLNRTVSECSLTKVQEVDAQTKWVLSNLFNFWLIRISTASETSDFNLEYMPDPIENVRKIQNVIHDAKWHQDDSISGNNKK